jgi:hypoxanthine phosphoribosyltransferase
VATSRPGFAHGAEADFSRLLDFYGIAWEYEPRSFPIAYGDRGVPVEFFTPDFYLPEYDTYVEVTVIKAKFQTRKNRKVRLLRESHPDITVKLLTRRDVLRLFERLEYAT